MSYQAGSLAQFTAGLLLAGVSLAGAEPRLINLETPEFRQVRREGFDALYNLEYAAAHADFQRMDRIAPDHPGGPLYDAATIWLEILQARRRLQTGLYRNSSFFGEAKEKIDPATDGAFRNSVRRAIARCMLALGKNDRDPEALYYQGVAHAMLASYETTVARSFISSLRNGSKAVDLHRKVLEIDPNFADAWLTIGSYDYVVGSLPFFVKILAAIGGFRGSKERGIEELHRAAEHGRYAGDDARVVLVTFYSREQRWGDALLLLDQLSSRYPRNYIFRIEKAAALYKVGRRRESAELFEQLTKEGPAAKVGDLIHYEYAETLVNDGRLPEASQEFRAAASVTGADAQLATRAHLRAAQVLDLLERRAEAIAEYQAALKGADAYDSHDQARDGLKRPYTGG